MVKYGYNMVHDFLRVNNDFGINENGKDVYTLEQVIKILKNFCND